MGMQCSSAVREHAYKTCRNVYPAWLQWLRQLIERRHRAMLLQAVVGGS